jgi:hypothetical protein
MQKIKYICDVQPNHFVVASIVCTHTCTFTDTQESHFSFAVFEVGPEDFIKALEDMIHHRERHETYYQPKEVVMKATRAHDTIRMTLDCASLAITRGNLKVLYHGSIDRLKGLPEALKKSLTPS